MHNTGTMSLAEPFKQAWSIWMLHTGPAHHVLCKTCTLRWHG